MTLAELDSRGLTPAESAALLLLTPEPGETFEAQALRIAFDRGPGGRIARSVTLADLDDHLRSRKVWGAPPYGWARQHVAHCQDRFDRPQIAVVTAA
jgi:hypothetical protein